MPTPLEEIVLDDKDFEMLATYADRLAESKQREAIEKENQKQIFEDAANSMEYKDMKKADATKLVKAAYENSKAQEKLLEADTLATAAENIGAHMTKEQV